MPRGYNARRMSRALGLALAVVLLSAALSPLQRELYVGDETKYSQVVREMRAGSFFLPTLEGSPFTHKPPLHFWLVDLLTYPLGIYSIWPFVLPSLAAFALLAWAMWRMGGPLAALVACTSLLMWGSAQTARMDVAFAMLLAASAMMLEKHFDADGATRGPLLGAALFAGIAFLVKGPMALLIAIALFAFEALRRRRVPRGSYALALLILLAVPLLWLVPAVVVGGEAFWREIFYKQTVGRAVGAWVHKSPPWFYVMRAPATLAPWFFTLIAAIVAIYRRRDGRAKFGVSWILAVLVPYTLLSSKLDVYMIAMIPAVAVTIARFASVEDEWSAWGRRANVTMLVLLALVGVAGLLVQPEQIKGEDAFLVARLDVRILFAIMFLAANAGIAVAFFSSRRSSPEGVVRRSGFVPSTIALGLVLVLSLSWACVALIPLANEMASTRPLVAAIERQRIDPAQIGLFVVPHLWVRGMNPSLNAARHFDAEALSAAAPTVIVVRRKNAQEIAPLLKQYQRVDELRMIGKWFDVYRR